MEEVVEERKVCDNEVILLSLDDTCVLTWRLSEVVSIFRSHNTKFFVLIMNVMRD